MTDLETIQATELKLLKSLCTFLDAHNLRYYLAFGTLLGAVRHQGFIPWDDDIDIAMPREDYNKLLSFPDSAFEPPFVLSELRRSPDHVEFFAKYLDTSKPILLHKEDRMAIVDNYIWIDIIPFDGVPKSRMGTLFIKHATGFLRLIYKWSVSNYHFKRSKLKNLIIELMSKCIPRMKVFSLYLKIVARHPFYGSERVFSAVDLNTSFYSFPITVFEPPVKILFEDASFYAPKDCKEFLEIQYGDFMKLPPQNEREDHGFSIQLNLSKELR